MKQLNLLLTVTAAVLVSFWSCKDVDGEDPVYESKLEERAFTSQALENNFIGDPADRKMMVYTPKGYNPNDNTVRYPVVYLLHGFPAGHKVYIDPSLWMNRGVDSPDFPINGFQAWMDGMMESGKVDPMIVVMPDTKTKYELSYYANSALFGNFEDFIVEDMVKFMDANYNTVAVSGGRAIIGHSQGGYGAVRIAMLRPGMFGTIAAHVAPLFFEGLKSAVPYIIAENPSGMNGPQGSSISYTNIIYGMAGAFSPNLNNPPYYVDLPFEYPSGAIRDDVWAEWIENDPYSLLPTHVENLKNLQGFYLDAGALDPWLPFTAYFHQALEVYGVQHEYREFNGNHWNSIYAQFEVSLKFCSDHMDH